MQEATSAVGNGRNLGWPLNKRPSENKESPEHDGLAQALSSLVCLREEAEKETESEGERGI